MDKLIDFTSTRLNTYYGRDTCLRIVQFFTLLIHGVLETINKRQYYNTSFLICSKQFSNCRIIMRLTDKNFI